MKLWFSGDVTLFLPVKDTFLTLTAQTYELMRLRLGLDWD